MAGPGASRELSASASPTEGSSTGPTWRRRISGIVLTSRPSGASGKAGSSLLSARRETRKGWCAAASASVAAGRRPRGRGRRTDWGTTAILGSMLGTVAPTRAASDPWKIEDRGALSPFQHPTDDRRALGVEEIAIRVGSGEGDHERRFDAVRQTRSEQACVIVVEGVDQRRPIGHHLRLDRRRARRREVPEGDLDAALGQAPRLSMWSRRCPERRWTERHREAEGHRRRGYR